MHNQTRIYSPKICELLLLLSVLKYIVKFYGVLLVTPVWLQFRIRILQYQEVVWLSQLILHIYFRVVFVTKSETAFENIPLKWRVLSHSTTLNNFIAFA